MPSKDRAAPGHRLTGGFHAKATRHTNVAAGDWHVAPTDEGAHRIARGRGRRVEPVVFTGSRADCVEVAMRLNAGEGLKAVLRSFGAEDGDDE